MLENTALVQSIYFMHVDYKNQPLLLIIYLFYSSFIPSLNISDNLNGVNLFVKIFTKFLYLHLLKKLKEHKKMNTYVFTYINASIYNYKILNSPSRARTYNNSVNSRVLYH